MPIPMWIFWLILTGVFFLIEILTVSFLMFWPGLGAFLAFIANALGFNVTVQIAVFAISTILLIIFMKPLVKKMFKSNDIKTNTNSVIGKNAIVIKEIDNLKSVGQVKVMSEVWSAISSDDSVIEKDATVIIEDVDGVKLKVKKV